MEQLCELAEIVSKEIKPIKIAAISDLHGHFPEIDPCDLVLIAGDLVSLSAQGSSRNTKKWYLGPFKEWIESLLCNKVLFIAGNHELHYRKEKNWVRENFGIDSKATYLENECYIYNTDTNCVVVYGTPNCHQFGNWAFMESDDKLREIYSNIPYNIDILLSHDAPYGCSDVLLEYNNKEHIGNIPLREAILEKQPVYNFHGHLHSTNHSEELLGHTIVRNCSVLTEKYKLFYKPIYIEL